VNRPMKALFYFVFYCLFPYCNAWAGAWEGAGAGVGTCHGEQLVGNVGVPRCPSPGQELHLPEAPYLLLHDDMRNPGGGESQGVDE
jgi:hypothetical protein